MRTRDLRFHPPRPLAGGGALCGAAGGPLTRFAARTTLSRTRERVGVVRYRPSACTISSVIFFASPNSIIVFGRKNSSLSTPA